MKIQLILLSPHQSMCSVFLFVFQKRSFCGRLRILLAIISTIAFLYGISCSVDARKARKHNPDKIKIEITDMESKNDDKNYYIYSDFSIKNNTSKTLVYLKITTYIYDSNGKSIGSIESTFGSGNNLNLEKKNKRYRKLIYRKKI